MTASNGTVLKAIPKFGEIIDYHQTSPAFLAVFLGKVFMDPEKQSAAEHEVHQILQGYPTEQKPAFLSVPNVEQGEFDTDGTITDIYKIAQISRDMQWPSVLVLDALSSRQLIGQTRIGEFEEVTALIVYLKPASEDQRPRSSAFFIRRLSLDEAIGESLDFHSRDWKKLGKDEQLPDNIGRVSAALAKGLYLYNPFGPVFMDEKIFQDAAKTSAKALESKPSLPAEMKQHIENFLAQDSPFTELTEAPAKLNQELERLDIISLIHLEPDQLKEAQKRIQETAEKANRVGNIKWSGEVYIHQWKPHLPANRRDVMRLFNRYLDNNHRPYYAMCTFMVNVPTSKEQNLVWAQWRGDNPTLLQHGSTLECLKRWANRFATYTNPFVLEQLDVDDQSPDSTSTERLLDPLAALPSNVAPWRPAVQKNEDQRCPPVFYLTNKLSEEEHIAVLDELYTFGRRDEDEKDYCFVTWEKEEDGGVEDMWALLKKVYDFRGRGRRRLSPAPAIFIDRDSPYDKKVVLADRSLNKYHGMNFGRLPGREATTNWIDVDLARIFIGECFRETVLYKDPNYDGPMESDFESEEEWDSEDF